jgi:hypothetical protein
VKLARRYQMLPDHAHCRWPGCDFEAKGSDAELAAAEHVEQAGHVMWVQTGAVVILSPQPEEVTG